MVFVLNEKTIKKNTTAVIFDRATKLYLNNYVKDVKVGCEKNSTLKVVEARVTSIEEKRDVKVEVLLGMRTETIEYQCECEDYKESNKKKACKHIVAALLRYLKGQPAAVQMQFDMDNPLDKKENKVLENVSTTEEKPESIKEPAITLEEPIIAIKEPEVVEKSPKKQPIVRAKPRIPLNFGFEFECICSTKLERAFLKLKIGESSMNEIRNIKDFLLALKHKSTLKVSNSFSFLPQRHSFKKEDIALLKLVSASNSFGTEKYDGRRVCFDEKEIKIFFDLLKNRPFDFIINGQAYRNKKVVGKDIPLEFKIKEEKGKVLLKQLNEIPIALTETKEYYFFRNQIYKPNATQSYRYAALFEKFEANGNAEIVYESDDTKGTVDLLTFKFKEICNTFQVDKIKRTKKPTIPLRTKVNISVSERGILARPIFCYGNIEIDPFSHTKYSNSSRVGKRDIDSERKVIDIIKGYHFIHSKNGFLLEFESTKDVVNFIKTFRDRLKNLAGLSLSEDFQQIKIYESEEYAPEIHFYNNYLEFSLSIKDITLRDIQDILEALEDGEEYYRLSSGDFISLNNKELQKIAGIIGEREVEDKSAIRGKFIVSRRISVFSSSRHTGNSGKLYARSYSEAEEEKKRQQGNEKIYEEKNKKLKEVLFNMDKEKDNEYIVPPELASIMRNYQKTGYKWFKLLANQKLGGILADDMGLGKTLQAIALVLSYVEECKENRKPILVVAPTSIIYNWENEIQKFAPELKSTVIYGTQRERRQLIEELENKDIIITTYTLMAKDVDEYKNIDFKYCFIDEAQQIKNARTQAARAVKTVRAEARFALTGTPVENSLSELWSIFDFVMPGYLLSHRSFKDHYENPIMNYGDSKALENLNSIIRPFILRRLKKEVLYELPPKTEQRLVVEMTEEQREVYFEQLKDSKQSLNAEIGSKGFSGSQIHIFSALTKLRQLCCHPSIIMPDYMGDSGKMLALDSIIEESILNNHRILLFSQFVSVLQILKTRFEENGVECLYLDGSIKSQERMRLVEEFNSGKGNVFLISLKAGGFGLNLTGADIVIHFDPWWNPAVEDQATDRAHRIGQTKNVEVIKLITKGSIEEKIMKLHERKKSIANSVISDKDREDSFISKLTQEEIEELFR